MSRDSRTLESAVFQTTSLPKGCTGRTFQIFYDDNEETQKVYEHWDEYWGGRIHCCIRAGLDLAVNPSGGVLEFTKSEPK